MELDDLKSAWQSLNGRVEALESAGHGLQATLNMQRVRSRLHFFVGLPLFELLVGIAWTALLARYLADQSQLKFFVPGLVWFGVGLVTSASSAWQLGVLATLDYAAPVLDTQRKLMRVRLVRLRLTQWLLLLSPLLWLPLAIVAAHGLLGLDLYARGAGWLLANAAAGAAGIALIAWIARRHGERFAGSTLGRRVVEALSGRSLAQAIATLDDISRFHAE